MPADILLTTLNARYIHSSLGLRYLLANMGELTSRCRLQEFTINQRPVDIAEQILLLQPRIVGIGCYIWNIQQITEVCALLKSLQPDLCIVLGGPEISFESESSPAFDYADYIIRGQADLAFARLCAEILEGIPHSPKLIDAETPKPEQLALPYQLYTDEDIRQRVIYVEASRGCPFKCEFCLSALDRTAYPFALEPFIAEMETLYQRGARHFKFVDRTFNLNSKISSAILEFFLGKPLHDLFLHFELIPDRLPDELKHLIEQFPEGCLQFEIGIQTFNPEVQELISRRQDHAKTLANLSYLVQHSSVHLHTDLIAGLPGEDLDNFAQGFDQLIQLGVQEIQLGILKRLRGAPINRHTEQWQMIYSPISPYEVLSTQQLDANTLFRVKRFARYWDLIGNSGRFSHSLKLLLGTQPFKQFMAFSDWLFQTTEQTHQIALPRLYRLLYAFCQEPDFRSALQEDFQVSGIKGSFEQCVGVAAVKSKAVRSPSSRQQRHLDSL